MEVMVMSDIIGSEIVSVGIKKIHACTVVHDFEVSRYALNDRLSSAVSVVLLLRIALSRSFLGLSIITSAEENKAAAGFTPFHEVRRLEFFSRLVGLQPNKYKQLAADGYAMPPENFWT